MYRTLTVESPTEKLPAKFGAMRMSPFASKALELSPLADMVEAITSTSAPKKQTNTGDYQNNKMQKMENIILKSISSKAVQEMAANSRLKEIDVWSLFFDSGCDYLDQLQNRITRYSVFKAQFGELMDAIWLKKTPTETFKSILASPHFWNWWSSQLWRACYNFSDTPDTEIYMRLMFNTSLIPQNVLFKIFTNNEQKNNISKQTGVQRVSKHRVEQMC